MALSRTPIDGGRRALDHSQARDRAGCFAGVVSPGIDAVALEQALVPAGVHEPDGSAVVGVTLDAGAEAERSRASRQVTGKHEWLMPPVRPGRSPLAHFRQVSLFSRRRCCKNASALIGSG